MTDRAELLSALGKAVLDGDAQIPATVKLTEAAPPAGSDSPFARVWQLQYQFDSGWRFVRSVAATDRPAIEGQPNELGAIVDYKSVPVWQALMARLLAIPGYVDLFHAAYPDGTRVTIAREGTILTREVKASRGTYNSTDTRVLHFGLGDMPCDYRLTVRALPFDYPDAPAQTMTLLVNGRHLEPITLAAGWGEVTWQVPAASYL